MPVEKKTRLLLAALVISGFTVCLSNAGMSGICLFNEPYYIRNSILMTIMRLKPNKRVINPC